MRLEY